MKRRFFLLAAPAIVAAPSLMRVSTLPALLVELPATWVSYGSLHVSQAEIRAHTERLWRETLAEVARTTGITDLMRDEPLRA